LKNEEDEGVKLWHSGQVMGCLDQGPQLRFGASNSQTLNQLTNAD